MLSIVRTRTTTYNIQQVGVDILVFNEDYRRIRGSSRYKGFQCFNCYYRFKDGDKIGLAVTDKGNRVLCHGCSIKFESELKAVIK